MTRSNASCGVNHLFFFPLPSPLSRSSSVNFHPTTSFLSYPKCNSASICCDRLIRKQVHFVVALDWCKRMSCLAGLSKMTLRWELSRNMLWILWYVIERFLIEWRKPSQSNDNGQSELTVKTNKLWKARENAGDQVTIGFSFASDWSREWRECSGPITARSKAKTNAIPDYFWRSIKNCSMR